MSLVAVVMLVGGLVAVFYGANSAMVRELRL